MTAVPSRRMQVHLPVKAIQVAAHVESPRALGFLHGIVVGHTSNLGVPAEQWDSDPLRLRWCSLRSRVAPVSLCPRLSLMHAGRLRTYHIHLRMHNQLSATPWCSST